MQVATLIELLHSSAFKEMNLSYAEVALAAIPLDEIRFTN